MTISAEINLEQARRQAARRLEAAGSASAMLDARVLLAHALNVTPEDLFRMQEDLLTPETARRFADLLTRREQGEPVAYITRRQEFWSLPLAVSPATLIPRADSETLIETVLEVRPDHDSPLKILDLGTGSGCLLLALLSSYPAASGVGVDVSGGALEIAAANAKYLGMDARAAFIQGRWSDSIECHFDVVISNPPYIKRDDIQALQPEVRTFEPLGALDGGVGGLDAVEIIVGQMRRLLAPGGLGLIEFGWDQADEVAELVKNTPGLATPEFRKDLGGHVRCVLLRHSKFSG